MFCSGRFLWVQIPKSLQGWLVNRIPRGTVPGLPAAGRVSEFTSPWGGRNCFFVIPGGAKYKILASVLTIITNGKNNEHKIQ